MFRTLDELSEATVRLAKEIAATVRRHETKSGEPASLSNVIETSMLFGYVLANRYKIDLDSLPPSEKVVSLHGNSISEADRRVVIAKAEIEARASGKNWGEVIAGWPYDEHIDLETKLIAINIIHELARENGTTLYDRKEQPKHPPGPQKNDRGVENPDP